MKYADSVTAQMQAILDQVQEAASDAVDAGAKRAATFTSKQLRGNSPTKSGEYKSGWATRKTGLKTYTVYNRKMPGLTHLLEKGHVIRNKKGNFGRVPGKPHIKPAEQLGIEEFEKATIEEANKRL